MSQPRTGEINREWVIESVPVIAIKGGQAVVSSAKLPVVSEAYFVAAGGTVQVLSASIIAHDRSVPDQGTIGGTQAATLAPQQFLVGFYGQGGSAIGTLLGTALATISATFELRGS
ncbi:MAG: hypothetical protein IVW52_05255 [Acidimicrobiales bacterium]|nr:hypothetical protein [Acidimicrobiales bacterium]